MNIPYLISITQNKINHLQSLKQCAELEGDIQRVYTLNQEIFEAEHTLNKLKTL
jgi:hypothetical protein